MTVQSQSSLGLLLNVTEEIVFLKDPRIRKLLALVANKSHLVALGREPLKQ